MPLCVDLWGLTVPIPELTPRWSGDQLLVSAPKLHFLTGDSLQPFALAPPRGEREG